MRIGKFLVSFIAVFTIVSPYLADWNETHIYNPKWTAHAKFHNAQTMVFGVLLGLLSLWALWLRKNISSKEKLKQGTLFASLYWLAQMPAILFPGTAFVDEGGIQMPNIFGFQMNQLIMCIFFILPILAIGYFIEQKQIKNLKNDNN